MEHVQRILESLARCHAASTSDERSKTVRGGSHGMCGGLVTLSKHALGQNARRLEAQSRPKSRSVR